MLTLATKRREAEQPQPGSAAAAWAEHQHALAALNAQGSEIADKFVQLDPPIHACAEARARLAQLRERLKECRADALLGVPSADLATIHAEISEVERELPALVEQSDAAEFARQRLNAKRESISQQAASLQAEGPKLLRAVFAERLAAYVVEYRAARDTFVRAHTEVVALALGARVLGVGELYELTLPLVDDEAFTHFRGEFDLRAQVEARRGELYAELHAEHLLPR
jgi:hypothetical protein